MELGFFGRGPEMAQWDKILTDPQGQVVMVIGHSGMGKTELLQRLSAMAIAHPNLKCGAVREEVTKTDDTNSILSLIMENLTEAASLKPSSFDGSARSREQWRVFLNILKIGDLIKSLKKESKPHPRERFLNALDKVSASMPENGRAVIIIDPEKHLNSDSDSDWAIVAKKLPAKIKLVFAQRPDDILPNSAQFAKLEETGKAVRLPRKELGVLDQEGYEQLLDSGAHATNRPRHELQKLLHRFDKHPYACVAAIKLLQAGVDPATLPGDPSKVAEEQFRQVKRGGVTPCVGDDAIRFFEAFSIFDMPLPFEAIDAIAGVSTTTRKALLADPYLGTLLRAERDGYRIYHAILSDYIQSQIDPKQKKTYFTNAAAYFRGLLKHSTQLQVKFVDVVIELLPEIILELEGRIAAAEVINNECLTYFHGRRKWDRIIIMGKRAIKMVGESENVAAIISLNIGYAYQMQDQFELSEREFTKVLTKRAPESPEAINAQLKLGFLHLAKHARDHLPETMQKVEASIRNAARVMNGRKIAIDSVASLQSLRSDVLLRKGRFVEATKALEIVPQIGINADVIFRLKRNKQLLATRQTLRAGIPIKPRETDPNHVCSQCGSYYRHPFAGAQMVSSCSFSCNFCGSQELIQTYFREQ